MLQCYICHRSYTCDRQPIFFTGITKVTHVTWVTQVIWVTHVTYESYFLFLTKIAVLHKLQELHMSHMTYSYMSFTSCKTYFYICYNVTPVTHVIYHFFQHDTGVTPVTHVIDNFWNKNLNPRLYLYKSQCYYGYSVTLVNIIHLTCHYWTQPNLQLQPSLNLNPTQSGAEMALNSLCRRR